MKVIAISGSMRANSSNTFLLKAIADLAKPELDIQIASGLNEFPIFSPDSEGHNTPDIIDLFAASLADSDGVMISCPEYVRAIPGGLKNAIDWLVSRQELIHKPIALVHASHRGDDMLRSLRIVLETVSDNFCASCFVRIPLIAPHRVDEMRNTINKPENIELINKFLRDYQAFIRSTQV